MSFTKFVIAAGLSVTATAGFAQSNPTVGGAPMLAQSNIVENASNSPIHTTLVAAVVEAGLVDTLASDGPFTVFAPTDDAFAALPAGSVEALLERRNRDRLTEILTCHVMAGEAFSDAISGMISSSGGAQMIETVGGCTFTARMVGGRIMIEDEQGRMATVTIADVDQSNGVIHVIDTVLLPDAM
ncbi:MAG: fasciclin domain-containing protein [Pseudomonadota bacterium]